MQDGVYLHDLGIERYMDRLREAEEARKARGVKRANRSPSMIRALRHYLRRLV